MRMKKMGKSKTLVKDTCLFEAVTTTTHHRPQQ
jgi:hypothetical protein